MPHRPSPRRWRILANGQMADRDCCSAPGGDYDRKQFIRECRSSGISYPFGDNHLNLKLRFSEQQSLRRRYGMASALRKAGVPLVGTHHRGIDDARNIARLLPFIVGSQKVSG